MELLEYLRGINLASISLRIVLAMVIGGILGLERGRKKRPAGFRTYMLVSLGSALVMMTNQYVYYAFDNADPVRMGAQVISGIGFLGAGTIIVTGRNQVKGITTAAGLWTAACSGLAIGIGFYEGALLGGVAIFIIMAYMQRLDAFVHSRAATIELYIEFDNREYQFSQFIEYARDNGFVISDVQISKNKLAKESLCAVLDVKSTQRRTHTEMVELLSESPGVVHLEEL